MTAKARRPSFVELFTPKLVTVLREGYPLSALKADALAGLTVAIVAIPLSMAIAIASGVEPERGLYTAIIGGFLISMLGGSRFQIGGPAGAFIVLVAATVDRFGVEGLLAATMMSGVILLAIGFLRLGTYIKYIPYPVTVGFTAGIAVIIFASQLGSIFGITLAGKEPGAIIPKLQALVDARDTIQPFAIAVSLFTLGVAITVRRFRPRWPAFLIAVGAASLASAALGLHVETIGTRFGGIPRSLPAPSLPSVSVYELIALLPSALSFALLGSIESLLSAVVADSMTGRRHRSNCELVAQGIGNLASALFGGICVTGAIARTATNIRAGARGPVSGILHAVFLLLFLAVAAPLAAYIPLAALAAVLAIVAWNMAERHAFGTLIRASRGDAVVLLATFNLTIFKDLTTGILVGFGLGTLLFLHRMAEIAHVDEGMPAILDDQADSVRDLDTAPYDPATATDKDVIVYRISGAFFFGSATAVADGLERLTTPPKAYVIDFAEVPILDSTAAATIAGFVRKRRLQGVAIYITGARQPIRRILLSHGVKPPGVHYRGTIADALESYRNHAAPAPVPTVAVAPRG
jgi:SulP family sulfate permease